MKRVRRPGVLLLILAAAPMVRAAPPNPMPPASVSAITLENGLTVITREDGAAPLAAVDLWIAAGAAEDGGSGAAHAVEHMVFKGGAGVPAGAVDARMEAAGGILFAETLADATHYWATVPPGNVGEALESLARLMHPPDVKADAWALERNVMLEEIARSRSDTVAELRRQLTGALYGPIRGAPVAGTSAALEALTPDQIRAFFRRHYRPDRMTLVVVGPISGAAVQRQAAKTLGALAVASERPPVTAIVPAPKSASVSVTRHVGNRVEAGMAFAAPSGAAVDVLCTILASRLGAETVGRADRVEVSHPWQSAGVIILAVGGPRENEAALCAALRRVTQMSPDRITPAAVEAAGRRRRWAWWLDHEKPADQTKALGLAASLGDVSEATEATLRLEQVTTADVRAAARAVFVGARRSD